MPPSERFGANPQNTPDGTREIVAPAAGPERRELMTPQQLSALREQIENAGNVVKQMVSAFTQAGGMEAITSAMEAIRLVSPNTAKFLETLTNMGIFRQEQLRGMLTQRNVVLTDQPGDSQRMSAILALAATLATRLPTEQKKGAVTMLFAATVEGITQPSITMTELLERARRVAPTLAPAAPETQQQSPDIAARFTVQLTDVRGAVDGVVSATDASIKETKIKEVQSKMAALNTALAASTPPLTADQRGALALSFMADNAARLGRAGFTVYTQGSEIKAEYFGQRLDSEDARTAVTNVATVLRQPTGAPRDKALTEAVVALNARIPDNKKQEMLTVLNTTYGTQMTAMGKRLTLGDAVPRQFELRSIQG